VGISRAEQSDVIDAPADACFEAIVDYESFPDWQRAVESIEVLERYEDGLGKLVRVEVDAKLRRITYTLHYHYERPTRVWWDFVEGDGVEQIEGEFTFEPVDSGERTRVTYRLGIDAGVPIPGLVARRLTGGVMGRSVRDLKDEVERRAQPRFGV
jgi:uncharacterized membrane protein